jgi:hypothetical protein
LDLREGSEGCWGHLEGWRTYLGRCSSCSTTRICFRTSLDEDSRTMCCWSRLLMCVTCLDVSGDLFFVDRLIVSVWGGVLEYRKSAWQTRHKSWTGVAHGDAPSSSFVVSSLFMSAVLTAYSHL